MAAGSPILSATKANLLNTLTQLAGLVDANDHFLFYSFDHGNGTLAKPGTTGEEVLCGWGEDIRDDELAPALRNIHGKYWQKICGERAGWLFNLRISS